jgi:uncharacterized membrane protein
MKILIYILLGFVLTFSFFFYHENYLFSQYTESLLQNDNMNIPVNEKAPVISKNQIEIEAPVEAVWETLTRINDWPSWQVNVTETYVYSEVKEGTRFDWKAGGLSFKSEIHTYKPKSMFGWTGSTMGALAIHNWFFEEKGNITIVKVEESLQGVFPKLFSSFFQESLDRGVLKSLKELKSAAEKSSIERTNVN